MALFSLKPREFVDKMLGKIGYYKNFDASTYQEEASFLKPKAEYRKPNRMESLSRIINTGYIPALTR